MTRQEKLDKTYQDMITRARQMVGEGNIHGNVSHVIER